MLVWIPLWVHGFIMSAHYQDNMTNNWRILESLCDIIVTKRGDLIFTTPVADILVMFADSVSETSGSKPFEDIPGEKPFFHICDYAEWLLTEQRMKIYCGSIFSKYHMN